MKQCSLILTPNNGVSFILNTWPNNLVGFGKFLLYGVFYEWERKWNTWNGLHKPQLNISLS